MATDAHRLVRYKRADAAVLKPIHSLFLKNRLPC